MPVNYLDEVRMDYGPEALKGCFNDLMHKKPDRAIDLINDDSLHFASLFLLKDEIDRLKIYEKINLRNKIALDITGEVISNKKSKIHDEYFICTYIQSLSSTLKWMLETGSLDDGLSKDYDKVMDIVSICLTGIFKNNTVLPTICDMIFKRNRYGRFYHDMLWTFFECRDINSLLLIANYLKSEDPLDVELSSKLLSFASSEISLRDDLSGEEKYLHFMDWINENNSYLRYTGESFQQSSNPRPYSIDLEAKYLCRVICPNENNSKALTQKEIELLNEFKKLNDYDKNLLSKCSNRLHSQNSKLWNDWLNLPIDKQLQTASTVMGWEND